MDVHQARCIQGYSMGFIRHKGGLSPVACMQLGRSHMMECSMTQINHSS